MTSHTMELSIRNISPFFSNLDMKYFRSYRLPLLIFIFLSRSLYIIVDNKPRTPTVNDGRLSATIQPQYIKGGQELRDLPDIVRRSLNLIPHNEWNLTAALCHKTLFGDIDLQRVLEWVAYHRLLGFDRIFVSHLPSVRTLEFFDVLESLPYVTLFENELGNITIIRDKDGPGQHYQRLGGEVTQTVLEARCLDRDAKDYDWVLLTDADEFLWFDKKIGLKDFLREHQQYDYLSFGKWMYTALHRMSSNHSSIYLDEYPFTAKQFCTMKSRTGKPKQVCANKNGRAKVMVRPSVHHGGVNVHGTHIPRERTESIHLPAYRAHLKEWNRATMRSSMDSVTWHEKAENFYSPHPDDVRIHGFYTYPHNPDGTLTMHYDSKLNEWFGYVSSRGKLLDAS